MVTDTLIPKGYQQTDIGVIPDDWGLKTLGELCELTSSKRIFESEYVSDGVPFYRGKEVSLLIENKTIEDEYFISEKKYDDIKREFGAPQKDDILITAVGTLGNVYVIPDNKKFYFKDGNLIWLRKIRNIDVSYLAIQIRKNKINIINNAIGSSQKALTIVVLKEQNIPLPPTKAEQTAIAIALKDANVLISSLEELLVKKRNIKQGAMQELLTGKKRLPGFSEKWEDKSLENCGKLTMGQSPPGNSYSSNDVGMPLLNGAADLKEDGILITQYTTKPTRFSKKGDLLFCIRATIGNLQTSDKEYCLGRGVAALNVNDSYSKTFVAFQLQGLFEMMRRQSQGGVIKGLRKDELAEMIIKVPKQIEEQTSIAQVLSDMDAEIKELEQKLDKYKMIKQGMMQELLTGKKRLI